MINTGFLTGINAVKSLFVLLHDELETESSRCWWGGTLGGGGVCGAGGGAAVCGGMGDVVGTGMGDVVGSGVGTGVGTGVGATGELVRAFSGVIL